MDFKNVSARLKQVREGEGGSEVEARPVDFAESYRIRGKMVGVLLRDARISAGRSVEDCARLLKVTPEQVEAWEYGDSIPSLPQLELLAFYLDVPVSHFWGADTMETSRDKQTEAVQIEYVALRNRMIGALLRQAREATGMNLEDLADASGLAADQINLYEYGESSIPMHELTVLASAVRKNMNYFMESSSQIGEWLTHREEWKDFTSLPAEVRQFAANPLNLGFMEIAMMFSRMPVDKLRLVGESILNITM